MENEKRTVNNHLCASQNWLCDAINTMSCIMSNCSRILDSDEADPKLLDNCHKLITALRFAIDDVNKAWFVLEGALLEKDIQFCEDAFSEQEAPADE
ncbi:MAG: hypothetical protein IJW99_10565 [Clostridia bacterium]|nr:hypothetical protein [Clostridia bacterium]